MDQSAVMVRAQFTGMLQAMNSGWRKGAAGRVCPECQAQGQVWVKVEQRGRVERHQCRACLWMQEYAV